jgi:hypothetical protein
MGIYEEIKRQAGNILSMTLFDGVLCKDCEFREWLDSDGLFECTAVDEIQCPAVASEIDNLIGQLEVALREKTL